MSLFLKKVRKKKRQDMVALPLPPAPKPELPLRYLRIHTTEFQNTISNGEGRGVRWERGCVCASKLSFSSLIWRGKETFRTWRLSSNILDDKYLLGTEFILCSLFVWISDKWVGECLGIDITFLLGRKNLLPQMELAAQGQTELLISASYMQILFPSFLAVMPSGLLASVWVSWFFPDLRFWASNGIPDLKLWCLSWTLIFVITSGRQMRFIFITQIFLPKSYSILSVTYPVF